MAKTKDEVDELEEIVESAEMEEEEESEEEALEPEAREFMEFIETWAPPGSLKTTHKRKILAILRNDPSIVRDTKSLLEVLTDVCGLSKKLALFLINKWAEKLKKEESEETILPYIPPKKEGVTLQEIGSEGQGQLVEGGQIVRGQEGQQLQMLPPGVDLKQLGDILKKKIADMMDYYGAMAILNQIARLSSGAAIPVVEFDSSGRPIVKVIDRQGGGGNGGLSKEYVEMMIEKKISEVEKKVAESINKVVEGISNQIGKLSESFSKVVEGLNRKIEDVLKQISERQQSESSNKQFELMIEMLKTMQTQITEVIKNRSNTDLTQLVTMFDKLIDVMRETKNQQDTSMIRDMFNMFREMMSGKKEKDPLEVLKMALDFLEKKLTHKEKVDQFDVKLRELAMRETIEKERLELERAKLKAEAEQNKRFTEMWMNTMKTVIDNVMRGLGPSLGETMGKKLGEVLARYVEELILGETTPTTAKEFESQIKALGVEELRELKSAIESSMEKAPSEIKPAIEQVEKKIEKEITEKTKTKKTRQKRTKKKAGAKA